MTAFVVAIAGMMFPAISKQKMDDEMARVPKNC